MIVYLLQFPKGKFNYYLSALSLFLFLVSTSLVNAQDWKEEVSSDGSLPIKRHECAYIEVDGKFYLLGGRRNGVDKYVNIYDPVTKKWTQGAKTDIPLHHFQPVVFNHKIYVLAAFTGDYPNETPVANIYIYDPSSDTWTKDFEIPQDRRRGSAGVAVYNNKFYIAGGIVGGHSSGIVKWLDEFDPSTNKWTALTDAPRERDHFQAAVVGTKLILAGGRQSPTNTQIEQVDVYDFTSSSWSTADGTIPTKRSGTAAVVVGEEIYIIGGEGGTLPAPGKAHVVTEVYKVSNNTWRTSASLITGRHATGAIYFEGKIYIVAGSSTPGGSSASELNSQEVLTVNDQSNIGRISIDDVVNFGQVINKENKNIELTVRNTSTAKDVNISQINISGQDRLDFTVQNAALPLLVRAGESVTITIRFEPLTLGDKTATITFIHDGENSSSAADLMGESVLTITSTLDAVNNLIKIYPNPFADNVLIDISEVKQTMEIKVYDSFGKLCKSSILNDKMEMLTGDLMPGVYYLQLSVPGESSTHSIKIIKK